MEKYSEVVGLPVLCVDTGKRIGIVKDVIFCPKLKEVKAFLLEQKGLCITKQVILIGDILNLGRDALIVNDCSCIKSLKKVEAAEGMRYRGIVKGLRIYSRSGQDLGVVMDVLFDHKTGLIEGVELSDGLLQDLVQGRNILPLFGKVEFGEENIVVDSEAVEEMSGTGGGLRNLLMKNENP